MHVVIDKQFTYNTLQGLDPELTVSHQHMEPQSKTQYVIIYLKLLSIIL